MFGKKLRWFKVFDSAEGLKRRIPLGRSETFEVGGISVCIAHITDGLFAIEDRCPHQGASLGGGVCNEEGNIVCPMHQFQFNVRNGRGRAGYIDSYPLEERKEGVFVQLKTSSW